MTVTFPDLASFGVSRTRGFLSDDAPLAAFRDDYYAPWDDLAARLPELIASRKLGGLIKALPVLSTRRLATELDLRRAYVVLAFLVHGHVWAGGGDDDDAAPLDVVPPQLSEPFLHVCERLGMEPVLSYAGLCLWNWGVREGAVQGDDDYDHEGFYGLDQLVSFGSFTGTRGEDAFYHVPVLIEAEGGPLLALLLDGLAAALLNDNNNNNSSSSSSGNGAAAALTAALDRSAAAFARMAKHLPKMYAVLDAHAFFHELRPFFSGGKGMEAKGLPRGVVFRRADGSEREARCVGGSAGQSCLFQALDRVLGVRHEGPGGGRESVFEEMRPYMPGKHRELLEQLSRVPTVRGYVEDNRANEALARAYDGCIAELRSWRGRHIAVVSKYIVQPARRAQEEDKETSSANGTNGHGRPVGKDGNSNGAHKGIDGLEAAKGDELQGTGGSALVPFLRQARDETVGLAQR